MKRPRTASDWIGVAVALAGCVAAVYVFGFLLVW